jgi:hypothetical protein
MARDFIKFNTINYRQGYIEVLGDIHDGCINIETTQIHPDRDITEIDFDSDTPELADEDFIANTEVELNIDEAKILVEHLLRAIEIAKQRQKNHV